MQVKAKKYRQSKPGLRRWPNSEAVSCPRRSGRRWKLRDGGSRHKKQIPRARLSRPMPATAARQFIISVNQAVRILPLMPPQALPAI